MMKIFKSKKIIVIIAVVVIALVAAAAVLLSNKPDSKATVVHIGTASGDTVKFTGITAIAMDLGYLEEELNAAGYEVEFLPFANGVAANEALVTGDIDFAILGDVPTATLVSNDIDITWFAVSVGAQNTTIIVGPDSDIQDVSDLEGKVVSYNIGTSPQFFYESVANYFQLDRDSIEEVNLTNANSLTAMATGDVDAAVVGEADALLLEKKGEARILITSADYPQWASQNSVVARTEFLEENPDAGVAYHRAAIRAREEVIKDPEKFYSALSGGKFDEYPELAEACYNIDNGEFNYLISAVNDSNVERLQAIEEFFYSTELLTNVNQVSDYVDNSYYEEAIRQLEAEK